MELVFDVNKKLYLKCGCEYGSARCKSYVDVNANGAFHWSTYPVNHGFCITSSEIIELARKQGEEFEKAVNDIMYKDQGTNPGGDTAAPEERAPDNSTSDVPLPDRKSLDESGDVRVLNN